MSLSADAALAYGTTGSDPARHRSLRRVTHWRVHRSKRWRRVVHHCPRQPATGPTRRPFDTTGCHHRPGNGSAGRRLHADVQHRRRPRHDRVAQTRWPLPSADRHGPYCQPDGRNINGDCPSIRIVDESPWAHSRTQRASSSLRARLALHRRDTKNARPQQRCGRCPGSLHNSKRFGVTRSRRSCAAACSASVCVIGRRPRLHQ